MDPIVIKSWLRALVLPPGGLVLIALLGLIMLRRLPKLGRVCIAFAVIASYALTLPILSQGLLAYLNDAPLFNQATAKQAQAIVVLGGGVSRTAVAPQGVTLGPLTLQRVRYAATLYRQTQLPILVSGGRVHTQIDEASLMRDALQDEFNVPVQWIENQSRDTHENALHSVELLKRHGITIVLLVSHDFDVRRARTEFTELGLRVISAPAEVAPIGDLHWRDFIPSIAALEINYFSIYELAALAVRPLRYGF